jgi:hypothetical protein
MFPLYTKTFPSGATELERLLNESVRRLFSTTALPVSAREKSYPAIAELRIALDDAKLRADAPRPPILPGSASPALVLDLLQVHGSRVTVGPALLELNLTARDVRLFQSRDAKDEITLILQSATDGEIEISAAKDAIESAITTVVKREAEKHGVTIEQVQLNLQTRSSRSLDAEVQLHARKLFFSTIIKIAAKLDLDEQLNATVSEVRCAGDGAIGSLACGLLAPQLQKVNGRSFSLMALPLGGIRLHDVRLSAADRLTISAEFGD